MTALACTLAAGLAGCGGPSKVDYARPYPVEKPQNATVDIQAQRFETEIRLTNTTAANLGPGTVWVNQQWAHPIDGLKIGESVTLSLTDFANEFNERFRAGGFFATERPDTVMQVQFEADGASEMLGLVAVGKRDR